MAICSRPGTIFVIFFSCESFCLFSLMLSFCACVTAAHVRQLHLVLGVLGLQCDELLLELLEQRIVHVDILEDLRRLLEVLLLLLR